MRILFILLLSTLFLNNSIGQRITLNDEFASSSIVDVHFLSEDSYIQALIIEDSILSGAIQWVENNQITKQIIIENEIEIMRFRVEPSGVKLDIQIHTFECDLVGNVFETILLDTITNEKLYISYENAVEIDFKDVYNFGDSVIYYLTYDKTIIKRDINAENDLIFNVDFFDNLLDFKFENDKVFIFGGDSLLSININTADTSLIETNGNYIYDMAEKGDQLYVLGSQSLDKFDANGKKVKSFEFPGESLFAYEILIKDDRIFMVGSQRENNYNKIVYELINDEIFVEIYKEAYENLNPGNMYWNPYSGLVLIGTFEYETYPAYYGSHGIMVDLEKENVTAPDLELNIHNIEISQNENGGDTIDISLMITNNSQDTAKNIYVHSSLIGIAYCYGVRFKHFEEELFPGETRVITQTEYLRYSSNSIDMEVCFVVNGSNRLFDPEFENHFVCTQVVGTDDMPEFDDSLLSISPNPVKNVLTVKGDFRGKPYEIFTLNGQKILSGTMESQIYTDGLNPGLYFLKISDGNSIRATKFMKSE